MLDRLITHRRALHMIPELGYQLHDTQAYVLKALSATCARIETAATCGVLAYLDFGKPETFAFRADMDALPITEASGARFCSTRPGRMHACGHDAHMAILLALAERLSARPDYAARNLLLIFQPAEEAGNGAAKIIESGALRRYNVNEIYACHVEPKLARGALASKPGAFMARSSEVHVSVKGASAHIARANEGADALEAGAKWLLTARAAIENEFMDDMRLFRFGRFISGTANNIIADFARLDGSLRAFDEGAFERMAARLRALAEDVQKEYGVKIDIQIDEGYPPLVNDAGCYARFKRALGDLEYIETPAPHLTAEDFACYTKHVPGLMFNIGLGEDTELHAPDFNFDETALLNALYAFERVLNA